MSLYDRVPGLESRTSIKADEIMIIRRLIVHRDADGALQISGTIERDLRTDENRQVSPC